MLDVSTVTSTVTAWLHALTPGDWVDIGVLAAAVFSIASGACHGLSGALPGGIGWVFGLVVGWAIDKPAHVFYRELDGLQTHPRLADALTLATMFLLAWGVAVLVRSGLTRVAKRVATQPADALLGAVAGAFRIALLLLLATGAMLLIPWPAGRDVVCHGSRTGRWLAPYATDVVITAKSLVPRFEPQQQPTNDDSSRHAGQ